MKSNGNVKTISRNVRKRASNVAPKHDIFEINKTIMDLLQSEYDSLDNLKKQLKKYEHVAINGEISEQYSAIENAKKLKEKIFMIESGKRTAQYIFKTENIIKEYEEILEKPIKIDFENGKTCSDENRKNVLLVNFVNIAKEYIDLDPVILKRQVMTCESCKIELLQTDDLLFVCEKCGYSERDLAAVTNYQDNSRINSSQRYVYDKRANFLNAIKEFQGIQNTTISDAVREDLRDQFESHGITKDRITKDHIYEFLKITKHSDNYKDLNLLYTEFTGKESPDISHLVSQLQTMFDMALPVFEFDREKHTDRINFMSGQFVLYKLLQLLGYPCSDDDFLMLKTWDRKLEHDQKWKIICEELGWIYIPTV